MFDIFFVVVFMLFPLMMMALLSLFRMSLFHCTIPSFVLFSLFVFSYVGLLPLYFGLDTYRVEVGVSDQDRILQMFFYSCWTIFAMALGMIACRLIMRASGAFELLVPARPNRRAESVFLFGTFLLCVLVLALYLSKVPSIALFVVFEDATNVETWLARSIMGNDFGSGYHWYSAFIHHALNFVTFALFANYLVRGGKGALLLFLLIFAFATFTSIMALEKAPLVWLLIGLFLVYVIARCRGRYPVRTILKLTPILLGVLVLLHIYFSGARDLNEAFYSVFSRAFTGSISPAYFYLEFFPAHHDFLLGRSFPNPGGLLPFEPYMLTQEIHNWRTPRDAGFGVVGSAPTVYWAEMYANFGVLGVLAAPFYVGAGLYLLAYFVDKLENTPIKMGLVAWLAMHYQFLSQTGLSGFIVDIYLVIVVMLVGFVISMANRGKLRFQPTHPSPT